jgi:DNA polymerase-3 subunit epsilon
MNKNKEIENKIQESINIINLSNEYKILRRVPEELKQKNPQGKIFKAAFIDLETTGLDPRKDEIIEVGVLIVSFTNEDGFIKIDFTNNQLQQPNKPISEEITKITGITNQDVNGKAIDWNLLKDQLINVDLIICHNAYFDRNFLELQTPNFFKSLIESKTFGCSVNGVNWRELGYEGAKLEYLNLKMGYFYEGHRALIDCYATLNLFVSEPKAFEELKKRAHQEEFLICATNASFDKKDELKKRNYRWSNGNGNIPKSWWIIIPKQEYEEELLFLKNEIYKRNNIELPTKLITAKEKYSYRGEEL